MLKYKIPIWGIQWIDYISVCLITALYEFDKTILKMVLHLLPTVRFMDQEKYSLFDNLLFTKNVFSRLISLLVHFYFYSVLLTFEYLFLAVLAVELLRF